MRPFAAYLWQVLIVHLANEAAEASSVQKEHRVMTARPPGSHLTPTQNSNRIFNSAQQEGRCFCACPCEPE